MSVALSIWHGEVDVPGERPPSMREIAAEVAQAHGLKVDDLTGPSRRWAVARPRQEAFWRCRQVRRADGQHRYSMPMIAAYFGRRDHTTILHGIRAHAARMCGESAE